MQKYFARNEFMNRRRSIFFILMWIAISGECCYKTNAIKPLSAEPLKQSLTEPAESESLETDQEVVAFKKLTSPDKIRLESSVIRSEHPFKPRIDIDKESYSFQDMGDLRYLQCKFRLLTNLEEKLKLYFVIIAQNFDTPYKIEQVIPKEINFNQDGEPDYFWGFEFDAENGMNIENRIPRPIGELHYNRLKYYFWNEEGQLLLLHEVKLK
jgi:hypothetical protein